MEIFVMGVENILKYKFTNKNLLQEALTHLSIENSPSYERLEYLGDAILNMCFADFGFSNYPLLEPGKLSLFRSANVSTEKYARVAVRSGLYKFIHHNSSVIQHQVEDFVKAVLKEDESVVHGGTIKAPKVLADIVESVAGAVYKDSHSNCHAMWKVMQPILEPIVKPEFLEEQPQPVSALYELCQKQGHKLQFKHKRIGGKSVARVFLGRKCLISRSSKRKGNAKFNAAAAALEILSSGATTSGVATTSNTNQHLVQPIVIENSGLATTSNTDKKPVQRVEISTSITDNIVQMVEIGPSNSDKPVQWVDISTNNTDKQAVYKGDEIDDAMHKLKELCDWSNWSQPIYGVEYCCSAQLTPTEQKDAILVVGETRSKLEDAQNSTASKMIYKLQEYYC